MKNLTTIGQSLFLGLTIVLLFANCGSDTDTTVTDNSNTSKTGTLFTKINANQSGIKFSNNITENEKRNYFNFEYIYNGGGVGIADFNKDGLQDVFLTGNEVSNRLYLNKGDFKFEDISKKANVEGDGNWYNGVSIVDINTDGLPDIYVCKGGNSLNANDRKNELYINQGDATFKEEAEKYGLAESGFSIQSSWFDYDMDGDLDVYITNHPHRYGLELEERIKIRYNPPFENRDKLYQNNGDGTFTETGKKSGIVNYGHGLGLATADVNQDGLPDIYIGNDYREPDYLYINQGGGKFKDEIKDRTGHIAFHCMGVDIADCNNDGLEDILTMEMLPKDYKRAKTNMASMRPKEFYGMIDLGLHYQYMHNTLQLNQGNGKFSEVARLSGISKTDWSWACLFADMNSDGNKDIFIANGYRRDVFDKDYEAKVSELAKQKGGQVSLDEVYSFMPAVKLSNFAFQNNGNLDFSDKTINWGLDEKLLTQGAAIADLDNDGDWDLVLNNLEETASLYRNNAQDNKTGNYLKVQLEGTPENPTGIGAKVTVTYDDVLQYEEVKSARGYLSACEQKLIFGLGDYKANVTVKVEWPTTRQVETISNVAINQTLTIKYKSDLPTYSPAATPAPMFTNSTNLLISPVFTHKENPFDDYKNQVLLPHRQSQNGPFTAVGDINGDGLEDFYIGGAIGSQGAIYQQNSNGKFSLKKQSVFSSEADYEDMGAAFFDADGDGDLDLYVASGGTEYGPKSNRYQDRLYLNNGNGQFSKAKDALPEILASGSSVSPCDYDQDGDIDLYVGGRIFPEHYPAPTKSYLLQNNGGKFTDVTRQVAPQADVPGMVTTTAWVDVDSDGWQDLVLAGEWMPISVFRNVQGQQFQLLDVGLNNSTGWWNILVPSDIDGDGDMDLVAGNLGLNHKFQASPEKPFHVYSNDYDQNGSYDIVLAKKNGDDLVPVRGKECSSEQMPFINEKFPSYANFADAKLDDILGEEGMNSSIHYEAKEFASGWIENASNKFIWHPFPLEAQFSAIQGIVVKDFTGNGNKDILLAGNLFQTEPETARADAGMGLLLEGTGNATFNPISPLESGLSLQEDIKSINLVKRKGKGDMIICGVNDGQIISLTKK